MRSIGLAYSRGIDQVFALLFPPRRYPQKTTVPYLETVCNKTVPLRADSSQARRPHAKQLLLYPVGVILIQHSPRKVIERKQGMQRLM